MASEEKTNQVMSDDTAGMATRKAVHLPEKVVYQKYIDSFEKNNERGISWRQLGGDTRYHGRTGSF